MERANFKATTIMTPTIREPNYFISMLCHWFYDIKYVLSLECRLLLSIVSMFFLWGERHDSCQRNVGFVWKYIPRSWEGLARFGASRTTQWSALNANHICLFGWYVTRNPGNVTNVYPNAAIKCVRQKLRTRCVRRLVNDVMAGLFWCNLISNPDVPIGGSTYFEKSGLFSRFLSFFFFSTIRNKVVRRSLDSFLRVRVWFFFFWASQKRRIGTLLK